MQACGKITVYAFVFPSRAERVIWCLNELNLDYHVIRLDPFKGDLGKPEIKALNPLLRMPVVVHNQQVLTESLAIMEYFNQLASGDLVPKGLTAHYQFRQLMSLCTTEFEAYLWVANQSGLLDGMYHWPEGTKPYAISRVKHALPSLLDKLKQQAYAVDNQFSLADIYLQGILRWAKSYRLEVPHWALRYCQRLEARPAYAGHIFN